MPSCTAALLVLSSLLGQALATPFPIAGPVPEALSEAVQEPAALESRALPIGGVTTLANFDDRNVGVAFPLANPIGIYKNLAWGAFNIQNGSLPRNTTLAYYPSSWPNVAVTGASSQVQQSFASATMSTQFNGSQYSSMILNSFTFGCITDQLFNGYSAAVSCTVQVTGYDASGAQIVSQQLTQAPTLGQLTYGNTMNKAILTLFATTPIAYATVIPIKALLGFEPTTLTSILLDDVSYTLFK